MIPSPVKFQLPERKGYITGFWNDNKFIVKDRGETLVLNENQAQILRELALSEEGLIASELARKLGLTHAGIIFLMRPLVEANLVQRASVRGGGVLYYVTTTLREQPSKEVKEAITEIEAKCGREVQSLGVKQLAALSRELSSDLRRSLIDWLLSGSQ